MQFRDAACVVALCCAAVPAAAQNGGESRGVVPRLSGSLDWEYYASDGESQGQGASFQAFRQRYGLNLTGALWDFRFNRYTLGLDYYRADRSIDGTAFDSDTVGYRVETTFFPGRGFPLRFYARESVTGVTAVSLADSDRETATRGVEWNLVSIRNTDVRLLYDETDFDLVSPVALKERRKTGVLEFNRRSDHRDFSFRYDNVDNKEQVNGFAVTRQNFALTDRTRFRRGATLIVSGNHTLTDSQFSSGGTDDLTVTRLSTVLDLPRKNRVGTNLSYDFSDSDGKFLTSTSHHVKARTRIRLSNHWESTAGLTLASVESEVAASIVEQDVVGTNAGLSYSNDWTHLALNSGYSVGWVDAEFNVGERRSQLNQTVFADLRRPFGEKSALLGSISHSRNENDTTGLGFDFDETNARAGIEGNLGARTSGRATLFYSDSVNDTFQFGLQESDEIGVEGLWSHERGAATLTLSSREGISNFLPDPSGQSPFLPGTDLTNSADVATLGFHWRLPLRLRLRLQARYEDREFTTIGRERVRYLYPQLDWTLHVWNFSLGYTRYERDNSTSFSDKSWLVKASRRLF